MNRIRKLEPVAAMAHKASEAALVKLGQSNADLERDQLQLNELMRYRDEYLARFRQADPMIMTAKKALDLRSFLVQLENTINAQQLQVEQRRQQVAHHQQHWQAMRTKEQAVETLITRYQVENSQRELKREQNASDEFTNASWLRRRRK